MTFRFLFKSLRSDSAAEDQTEELYLTHGRIEELKPSFKTDLSPNILKDFLNMPIFCTIKNETGLIQFSKVNFESRMTPRILKESQEVKGVLPMRRSG